MINIVFFHFIDIDIGEWSVSISRIQIVSI